MTAIWKKKPALLITIGTAVGLIGGGATAWWLLQRHTPISELPIGANVLPETTAVSFSVSTDAGQWRQLRQFGTSDTQLSFDRKLVQWRDRLFTDNGINYQQDIQPWVGEEITVAFLNAPEEADAAQSNGKEIKPYRPPGSGELEQSAVMILPIDNPERVEQFIAQPNVTPEQEWVDREYQGVTIREVHGDTALDYAVTLLDDRFVVASGNSQLLEQVIDTYQGNPSIARNSDYGRAFSQLQETVNTPFMRVYVNVPATMTFTTNNANQPIPAALLTLLQNHDGLVSAVTLEPDGMRFRGATWVAPNSNIRLRTTNDAERMPVLLPAETVLMASGSNLKSFWENYSQSADSQNQTAPAPANPLLSANTIRQFFRNFTGLDWDQDIIPWTDGEFSLAVLSAPASGSAPPTTGLLLLMQVSNRRQADDAFQQLDQIMQERNGWQVKKAEVEGQPVVNWTSRFEALTVTRGWLDGNVVYLAIGSGVAEAVVPTPTQSLVDSDLFRAATASEFDTNSGHFFMAVDQLADPNVNLPVPDLASANQDFLSVIRAIGLTTAVQDNRTTQFDLHTLIQRSGQAPKALPAPGEAIDPATETSPSRETSSDAAPSADE